MNFTLPSGASLQDSDGGGAAIVKDGQTLATVSAPTAQDAAGNDVPVTTSVSGDSLELNVPHQNAGLAYPINVDPVTDVYTGSNGGIGAFSTDWSSGQSSGGHYTLSTSCTQNVSCTSGTTGPRGLYIHAPTNQTYSSGQSATWLYTVPHWPSSAYISALTLGPIDYDRHSGTSTNPYLAAGIFSPSTFSWLSSMTQSTNIDDTYWILGPPNQQSAPNGQMAVFQLYANATQSLTHWRHAFLSGAQLDLSDTDNPTVNVDTSALTSNWIDGKQTTSFQVPVADGGLGVSEVMAPGPDGYDLTTFPSQSLCVGTHASPCPSSASASAGYYPNMWSEGQSQSLAIVWDALYKPTLQSWNIRVDKTPPDFKTISGGLSQAGSGDPYKLHVEATDGTTDNPANWRSGVRRIQVFINDDPNPIRDTGLQPCTVQAGSCPLSPDFTFDPSEFTTDHLHFKVMATDELGHARSEEWDIALPDTSMGSGPDGSTSDDTPTFSYSSTISGANFQCRVDNDSFSPCPSSGYTASHLSDGQHTFYVTATDTAGHVDPTPATRTFTVDTQAPSVSIDSGPAGVTDDAQPLARTSFYTGGWRFEALVRTGASPPPSKLLDEANKVLNSIETAQHLCPCGGR